MAFTNNFRIERIYFEKLKSNIDILKSYIEAGATGEALELLKNSVDVDGAVLLMYRNLGEAWAELADLIQKTQKDLKDLAEKTEAYHDELNERIDEVNNYLMALIRELDARLQAVEQDLATMNRNKFYDLVENDGSYLIEKDGVTVSFDDIKADADFPHDVILRYDNGTSVTELEIREFTDSRIDFYSIGLADSDKTVKEILVSIADTEAVTYSENTLENPLYTFGTGLSLDSDNELSVDFSTVQAKLTEGTGIDIDSNNEISVDTSVIQAKLSEGFGIDIDSNNEIKVDTADVQEKLIAGQNITLTPDSTDPTKTVIDATGGSSYIAGDNITITPDTSDPTKDNISAQVGIYPSYSTRDTLMSNSIIDSQSSWNQGNNTIFKQLNYYLASDNSKKYRYLYGQIHFKRLKKNESLYNKLIAWANKCDFTVQITLFGTTFYTSNGAITPGGLGLGLSKKIEFDSNNELTDYIGTNVDISGSAHIGYYENVLSSYVPYNSGATSSNRAVGTFVFYPKDETKFSDLATFVQTLGTADFNQLFEINLYAMK